MNVVNQNTQCVTMKLILMLIIILTTIPFLSSAAEDGHDEEVVVISDSMARASGIETLAVSAGQINNLAILFGDVTTDPASLSHIRARFDGVISS